MVVHVQFSSIISYSTVSAVPINYFRNKIVCIIDCWYMYNVCTVHVCTVCIKYTYNYKYKFKKNKKNKKYK